MGPSVGEEGFGMRDGNAVSGSVGGGPACGKTRYAPCKREVAEGGLGMLVGFGHQQKMLYLSKVADS